MASSDDSTRRPSSGSFRPGEAQAAQMAQMALTGYTGSATGFSGDFDEDGEAFQPEFSDVFSTRRPKDAMGGISSGLKSIGKGVAGGVAALIAAPTIGITFESFLRVNHKDDSVNYVLDRLQVERRMAPKVFLKALAPESLLQ